MTADKLQMRFLSISVASLIGAATIPYMCWRSVEASSYINDSESNSGSMDRIYKWISSVRKEPQLWDKNWDCRDDANRPRSRVCRHIYLIRHGQFLASTKSLTDLGKQQAASTGTRLKLLDRAFHFNRIVNSSQLRAVETADIIHGFISHLPRETDNMLAELTPCMPDYRLDRSPSHLFRDTARAEAAFRRYFYRPDETRIKDSHELIVCHANVIRFFVCRALQLPPQRWLALSLDHCSITHIVIDDRGHVGLNVYSESGHLPPHQVTRSNVTDV